MPNSSLPLDHQLEAILFMASEPLSVSSLASLTGADATTVQAALDTLNGRLTGGIRLAYAQSAYRLVTAPEAGELIAKFMTEANRQDLSKPALETLAIVAYKGPLTKPAIETIRGVASETMLRNLTARGLIAPAGRSTEPGRPPLYTVTHAFLQQFGLTSPADLPPLPEDEA